MIARVSMASALLCLAASLPYPAVARPATDVLVMKNGDRITCEVKNLEGGVLRVNLDYVDGTLSIDWLKVERLESSALFLVQLKDGSSYSGRIISPEMTAGIPVKIEIQPEGQESLQVEKSDVTRMTQTSDNRLKRFSGGITLGSLYSKGNSNTQYSLGSDVEYKETNWGGRVSFSSNLSSSSGAEVSTRNQVDLTAFRLLRWRNYFYAGTAGFLQGSVQGIEHQTALGSGLGRYLKNTNRVTFSIFGGLGWLGTQYVPSAESEQSQNVGVALIATNLEAFRFKKARLIVNASVSPALTDTGRLFAKMNASYYLKLFGKIDWNLSFYGNWDTRPPVQLPSSDYGTSTGLSWSFGNK